MRLNLTRIPIIAIAKREEKIYTLGSKVSLDINKDSQVSRFIQQVRNEAHRFALKYHHVRRRSSLVKSNKSSL